MACDVYVRDGGQPTETQCPHVGIVGTATGSSHTVTTHNDIDTSVQSAVKAIQTVHAAVQPPESLQGQLPVTDPRDKGIEGRRPFNEY